MAATCELAGQFCTECKAFRDHSTPVKTSHSRTGVSGCPECLTDSLRPVVEEVGDDRTVTGGYIPAGQRDDAITVADAVATATGYTIGDRVRVLPSDFEQGGHRETNRRPLTGTVTNRREDNRVLQFLVDLDHGGRDWYDAEAVVDEES